jgi:hypothetical protein
VLGLVLDSPIELNQITSFKDYLTHRRRPMSLSDAAAASSVIL